jgi:hypothetical protein
MCQNIPECNCIILWTKKVIVFRQNTGLDTNMFAILFGNERVPLLQRNAIYTKLLTGQTLSRGYGNKNLAAQVQVFHQNLHPNAYEDEAAGYAGPLSEQKAEAAAELETAEADQKGDDPDDRRAEPDAVPHDA